MSGRGRLLAGATGALVALVVVAVLALVGVFDSGGGGGGKGGLPTVASARAAGDETWLNDIYDRAAPAVLFVQARIVSEQQSPFGPRRREGISTGTGFLIDDQGRVLTNAHVVENATDVRIRLDDKLIDAKVVGADLANDLALLEVDPGDLPDDAKPLPLGDSDTAEPGDPVAALGNPLGLNDTITAGIVSAKQRRITAPNGFTIDHVIQTDAAVNPGNSGGPLINRQGQVIGVNSQIATAPSANGGASPVEGFIGIAFAIPINTAKEVIADLEDDGKISRAYLGVSTVTLTPQLGRQLGIDAKTGALVLAVANGSPADRAGLRGASPAGTGAITQAGDVIVKIGDTAIHSAGDLGGAIAGAKPGQTVKVVYVRGNDQRSVDVELADAPSQSG